MVWRVPSTLTQAGTIVDLGETDNVLVGIGVTLTTTGPNGTIRGTGSNHDVRIMGRVESTLANAILIGNATTDVGNRVTISQQGVVQGSNGAVVLFGDQSQLTNDGLVSGHYGVIVSAAAGGTSTVVNNGMISGTRTLVRDVLTSLGTVIFVNNGAAEGNYGSDVGGVDIVVNNGLYIGYIDLSLGNDSFDGRLGVMEGAVSGGDGDDSILGGADNDTLLGDAGNDFIAGNGGADTIYGGTGLDTLQGGAGNDMLFGENAADSLFGGQGNDVLVGGLGADILNGALGTDTASYNDFAIGLTVDLLTPSLNTGRALGDTFVSIENLEGSGLADSLYGDHSANQLIGLNGSDTLFGRQGDDFIDGGAGADTIYGGQGNDTLTGGTENDTFVFVAPMDADLITDFTAGAGVGDVMQLSLGTQFNSFTEIQAVMTQQGANTIINFGGGDTILVLNVLPSQFAANDFAFF